MSFEKIIGRISSIAAFVVVYLLASGIYLSSKGFQMGPDGSITLVKSAYAIDKDSAPKKISKDILIPWGRSMGSDKAKVTIYEYSSYGCSHCAHFQLKTLPEIQKNFIDTGLVRLVFNDFPLEQRSMQASMLTHCFEGEKYFKVSDLLFEKQREWGFASKPDDVFKKYAYLNGLSEEAFDKCMKDKEKAQEIMDGRQFAITHLGISGTPSFVISSAKGREVIYGAPDYDTMAALINKYLPEDKK